MPGKNKKTFLISLSMLLAMCFSISNALAADLPDALIPMGDIIGISVKSNGAVISELSEIETSDGTFSPAKDAGLRPGDIITGINGIEIKNASMLMSELSKYGHDKITVEYLRNSQRAKAFVTPVRTDSGTFIGIWIKDALYGIGTATFYDPGTSFYGALGHSVSDGDAGCIFPISGGDISSVTEIEIVPGKAGAPGQLSGVFDPAEIVGDIDLNCSNGIYGVITDNDLISGRAPIETAAKSDIKTGKAVILSACSGKTEEYSIEITRIYPDSKDGRTMMIKVTDENLIAITGGIVQGMSGSPIIQDGKLVGAVTHVLISDPKKGYGISIEEMFRNIANSNENAA